MLEGVCIHALPKVVLGILDGHINVSVFPYAAIILVDTLVESTENSQKISSCYKASEVHKESKWT